MNKKLIQKIKSLYLSNTSQKQISVKLNISQYLVHKTLIQLGINLRNRRNVNLRSNIDDHYFKVINSEEKAYWLGYLYADGCVKYSKHKRKNGKFSYAKTISLSSIDVTHLEKFRNSLKYTNSVKNYNNISVLYISNPYIYDDLVSLGCVERKTFILKFPNSSQVPKEYISHFIRGYFDGDGGISLYRLKKTNELRASIDICGIYSFLNDLLSNLNFVKTKIIYKDKRKSTDCWEVKSNSMYFIKGLFNYMYKDATVYLERKYDKFVSFLKQKGSETIISKS